MKCKLCGESVEKDQVCYGCDAYICDECNTYPDLPGGKHLAGDHLKLKGALQALADAQKIVDAIVNKK